MHTYSYLALGDSYSIGESVELYKSFPYQVVQLLREKQYNFHAPEIIAKTGWTTDELEAGMNDYKLLSRYDFVSLLIGVNNQYRGRDVIEYKEQFEQLLEKAIRITGKKDHVIVVSIPDYSVTPFARNGDPEKVSREIEVFNTVNRALSIQYKAMYIDITTGSKEARDDVSFIAQDGLHPSAKEYSKWARQVADHILSCL